MPFPSKVKEDALVACQRCCCLCHKFCGIKIEVHHICQKSHGGADDLDNAIPLCFDCHADQTAYDPSHPKGNKYSESELRRQRDNWYAKVAGNIGVADAHAVAETDRGVYRTLVGMLPWHGSIEFFRYHLFATRPFPDEALEQLSDFYRQCLNNPAFAFIDPDLEALRAELEGHVEHFVETVETELIDTATTGFYAVPPEWEFDQPDKFRQVVKDLEDDAAAIAETYDNLVRTATRKLGVLPDTMMVV